MVAERFAFAELVVLRVTLRDAETFVDEDVDSSVVEDSFVVTIEEMAPYTEDYFHAAAVVVVWRVLVSSWANKLVLVAGLLPVSLQFDLHSLATYCGSFDVTSQTDCDPAEFDGIVVVSSAGYSSLADVEMRQMNVTLSWPHVEFAMVNEIVGIELAVAAEYRESNRGQEAVLMEIDAIVVVAVGPAAVADDFESFDLSGIVSAELELVAIDLPNGHSPFDRAGNDRRQDVELLVCEKFDVELRSRTLEALEFVVVVSHTFDDRFADNVETFFVGLAADVEIEELMDILAEESCFPSYSVVLDMPIAFVLDLVDSRSYVVYN